MRTLFLATAVVGVLLTIGLWLYRFDWVHYEYASFDCGQGRRVVITGERFWEVSEALRYKVVENGVDVVSPTFFDNRWPGLSEPDFALASAEGDALFALYDRKTPYEIGLIHDFGTGDFWTSDGADHVGGAQTVPSYDGWRAIRRRIESEHPHLARINKLVDHKYLRSVDDLVLHDAGVTDSDLQKLNGLEWIRCLRLNRNRLTDQGLRHLAGLKGLRVLELSGNDITGAGFEQLATLNLERLYLDETNADDAGLRAIGHLSTLQVLHLNGTKITDEGIPGLYGLKDLRFLYLRDTSVKLGIGRLAKELRKVNIDY